MSLIDYEEVRPWARAIKYRTGLRDKPGVMPPWYIEKDIGIQQFKDDPSLSDHEIALIAQVGGQRRPAGQSRRTCPPPVPFIDVDEWEIGQPDLIVSSPSFEIAGDAPDWWGSIGEVPTGLTEDRYVAAMEYKEITERSEGETRATVGGLFVVHHATLGVTDPDPDPNEDDPLAAQRRWPTHEVGRNADVFDPEAGKIMKAGSSLQFNSMHLHANGADTRAHLEVGFRFHPRGYQPTRKWVRMSFGNGVDLDIEAMDPDQQMESYFTLPENTLITIFEPHMHAPGVRMCLDAIWGHHVQTLNCAGYDHSWVRVYNYEDDAAPLLPKGTILRMTGYFDNSPSNPNVPDPRNWSGGGAPLGRPDVHQPDARRLPDRRGVRGRDGQAAREPRSRRRRGHHRLPALRHGRGGAGRRRRRTDSESRRERGFPAGRSRSFSSPGCWSAWPRRTPTRSACGGRTTSGRKWFPPTKGGSRTRTGPSTWCSGRMNRNWEEELHIPIGPDNTIEPGGPDQGQPTWFLPRRNRFLFRIRVPADFGDKELVWTLTSPNGETKRAYGTLLPDYYMDNNVRMANNGAGVSGDLFKNVGPTLEVHGESTRKVKANEPVTLTAVAHDEDGLPTPRRAMRPVDPARPTSLTPIAARGLRLSWFVYRAAGPVTFDPVQAKVWEDTRANSNSPWGAGWETPGSATRTTSGWCRRPSASRAPTCYAASPTTAAWEPTRRSRSW